MQTGLTEIDENGNYSGYTYEYLQEMAQYNGWNFEFVTVEGTLDEQLTKLLDMLGKGEIDIMGGIVYSDELAQVYDYPGYSYGTAYSTLNVLQENTKINEANYQSIKDLKIALLSKAKNNNAALEQFCEMNGISPQITYCDDEQSMMEMLSNGTVDAVPGVDMSPMNGTRAIAKYSPKPYYFITTKGCLLYTSNRGNGGTLNRTCVSGQDTDVPSFSGIRSGRHSDFYYGVCIWAGRRFYFNGHRIGFTGAYSKRVFRCDRNIDAHRGDGIVCAGCR